jgi:hypothetical protein
MPRAALEQVTADHVAPAAKLGDLVGELTQVDLTEAAPRSHRAGREGRGSSGEHRSTCGSVISR